MTVNCPKIIERQPSQGRHNYMSNNNYHSVYKKRYKKVHKLFLLIFSLWQLKTESYFIQSV